MYIPLVVLYFDLIRRLVLIIHELRAEFKVDMQNVVRRRYGRWAKPRMYQLHCD